MGNNTVQVNLMFNANVAQAKKQMQDLQNTLSNVINQSSNVGQLGITKQISEARQSAMELKTALNNAMNTDTGKLNLNKFRSELALSGKNLQQYATQLRSLGPEGVNAFNQMSQAIVSANTKIISLSGSAKQMMNTLFSSVRYSLAYGAINAVAQGFSDTISYAKELDTALTDIRMVTGRSAEDMAKFAKQANEAAKALSTTTTKYAEASLIYFQQGLSESEVKARTETTIKLANAVGQSAAEVSDWMTSIWNNFADGSKSLEYYADVVAKLGAATASSADEIATGLEKFAAIADTVGLSYEYATAALATVTAETRQSAEVVGTAFKTLFSRMEGLKLGETLDDGTTLNQYSSALMSVGVNIKDVNGELKDMDTILDETALRWQLLSRDQQVALAQGVAGIRQYSQFIALMDNYDVMQNNIKMAKEASGALTEMYKGYEDSVQGAEERSKAAEEALKNSLAGAKDLKGYYNFMADFLEVIGDILDAFGGLPTLILAAAAALTKLYQPQIVSFFSQSAIALKGFFGIETAKSFQLQSLALSSTMNSQGGNAKQTEFAAKNLEIEELLVTTSKNRTSTQQQIVEWEYKILKAKQDNIVAAQDELMVLEQQTDELQKKLQASGVSPQASSDAAVAVGEMEASGEMAYNTVASAMPYATSGTMSTETAAQVSNTTKKHLEDMKMSAEQAGISINEDLGNDIKAAEMKIENFGELSKTELEELLKLLEKINGEFSKLGSEKINEGIKTDIEQMPENLTEREKAVDLLKGVDGRTTDADKGIAAITAMEATKGYEGFSKKQKAGFQSDKKSLQDLSKQRKEIEKNIAATKKGSKEYDKYNKQLDENKAKTKAVNKQINERVKSIKKDTQNSRKNSKSLQENTDALKQSANNKRTAAKAAKQDAQATEEERLAAEKLREELEGKKPLTGAQVFGQIISGAASAAMGLSMLTSAFESLGNVITKENASTSEWITTISSLLFALPMFISGIKTMTDAISASTLVQNLATKSKEKAAKWNITKAASDKLAAYAEKKHAEAVEKSEGKKKKSILGTMAAKLGEWIASGPWGWAIAAISAAAIAALGFGVILPSLSAGASQAEEEKKDEQIEKNNKTVEGLNQVAEQTNSLDDSIQEFKDLTAAGEDTYEALQKITEQADELVKTIDELTAKKEIDIDSGDLQAALDHAKKTGDITQLEEEYKKVQDSAKQQSSDKAYESYQLSGHKSEEEQNAARATWVENQNAYLEQIGAYDKILADLNTQSFSSAQEMSQYIIDYIEKLTGYAITTQEEIDAVLASLDSRIAVKLAQEKWFEVGGKVAASLGVTENTSADSNEYKKLTAAKEWFDKLSDEDKTLAYNIDFTTNDEDWAIQLELIRKKAQELQLVQEAEKLGIDENAFKTYADILADVNPGLEKNSTLTKQIALNNIKLNKGLSSLADGWKDISEVLAEGKRGSIEYAQAIGKIQNALEEAFEYAPDSDFIEANLETIQKIAQGDMSALQELQDKLAENYVYNLEFKSSLDENIAFTADYIQNTLLGVLDELSNTPIELGSEAEISQQYLDTLQEMLYNGQLTEEELQKMMRMKGFEMNITGWDTMPGPVTTTYQTVSTWDDKDKEWKQQSVNRLESSEDIKIPIINGDTSKLKGKLSGTVSGSASIRRSSNPTTINTSTVNKNKGAEKEGKKLDEEIERYYKIDKRLQSLERDYDRLSKAKERAFGQGKLDLIDEEIKKIDELAEATQTKLLEAEEYLATDKSKLIDTYGVSFDEYGNISNYDELMAKYVAQYNTNPEAYEDSYEEFLSSVEQYEETLGEVEDLRDEVQDKQNERFDKTLEKAEYVVEYGTSLVEDSLAVIDYQLEKIEDDAYKTAEALALIGKKMSETSKNSATYTTGIETVLGASGLSIDDIMNATPEEMAELVANGTFTAEQVELLRNYRDGLLDTNREMKEMADEALDKLIDHFDTWNEKIQENIDNISHLRDMTQSYRDIIDLVGKDTLGVSDELLDTMNDFTVAASKQQVAIAKQQLEANKESLEQARLQLNTAVSEEEKERWQKVVDNLEKTVQEGKASLLASTKESLQAIQDAFTDTLDRIVKEFEDAAAGIAGSMEALQSSYDIRKQERERYVADYAKIYELSKLTRDINKSMDETDSIRGKKQLLELQEEINAMQESGVEMTQFEANELRARYDLKLAEIALEEAQNAKNQVRMSRDAEGNWGYVYTADQSKIDSAQQNYEDKLYAYQNLTNEYVNELESQILALPGEMSSALRAIWEDASLSDEEKETRAQEVIDFYTAQDAHLKQQMEKALGKSKELYDNDWKNYNSATGYKISKDGEWAKQFSDTILSQTTGYTTLEEYQFSFASAAQEMGTKISKAYKGMQSDMAKTLGEAGLDVNNFAGQLTGIMKQYAEVDLPNFKSKAEGQIEKMGTDTKEAFEKAGDAWKQYADYVSKSATANEELATAINNLITTISSVKIDTTPYDTIQNECKDIEIKALAATDAIKQLQNVGGTVPKPTGSSLQQTTFTGVATSSENTGVTLNGKGYIKVVGSDGITYYIDSSDFSKSGDIVNSSSRHTTKRFEGVTAYTDPGGLFSQVQSQTQVKKEPFSTGTKVKPLDPNNNIVWQDDGNPNSWRGQNIFAIDKNGTTVIDSKNGEVLISGTSYNRNKDGQVGGLTTQMWIPISKLQALNTGGYTGEWDSSGRLAMLHQKELVLNAHDTENFLAGITVLRNIVSMIDLQAAAQQYRLDSLSHFAATAPVAQTLQQDVTIHAEFPNATDRHEIEEAFGSLLNRASQLANRKN